MMLYTLDENKQPVLTDAIGASFLPRNERVVEQTFVDEYEVSTVFLMLDHGFNGGPPLLWETMIFALNDDMNLNFTDLYCDRYASYEAAKHGHRQVVAALLAGRWPE